MSSLPLLQSQIRRDPAGYEQEYRIQFRSFETTAQTFHITPGRPHKHFQELVSFIAHVYPCYPELREELNFPQMMFATLRREPERIHPAARKVLVAAVLALLRRDAVPLMTVLTELFKLFAIEDKELRALLHGRFLTEISSRTTSIGGKKKKPTGNKAAVAHVPPTELKKRVQEFFMKFINNAKSTPELVLRAVASLVCGLYKRTDWIDEFTVNSMMAALCRAEDSKVSSAAMYVYLGDSTFAAALLDGVAPEKQNKKGKGKGKGKNLADENDSDIEEDGSRRSKKKKAAEDATCDFNAIDSLVEPYAFTEDLLKRAMNNTDRTTFDYRLLALRVVCRMVYRRELVLPNLYPFLEKYLFPSNRHVTKVLACLAQACHGNVPPEEMQSVVRHVLNQFVSDHCRPEVITVGLNALRGICERAPLALSREQLLDIVQYRHSKTSKSVSCAARALLNLYREIHPELLHRSVRGKDAAIAVQKGTTAKIRQFGDNGDVCSDIAGIELLVAAKKRKRVADHEDDCPELIDGSDADSEDVDEDDDDDEEGDDDEEEEVDFEEGSDEDDEEEDDEDDDEEDSEGEGEEEEESTGAVVKVNPMTSEVVLSNEDFRRIKKLRTIAADDGSIDSDDLKSEAEDEEDEETDWILNPEKLGSLAGNRKPDAGLAAEERKAAHLMRAETRRGGLTHKEKRRNKPLMMSVQKQTSRKKNLSAAQKYRQIRTHVSNLKKQFGPQKRRRTGKAGGKK